MAKAKTQKQKDAELKEKQRKLKEAADKAAAEAEESEEDEDGTGDTDTAGDHDDAEQDVELIKKMLKDYVGEEADGMDEAGKGHLEKLAKEAYQCHKEMGKKEDEAYKCAGEAVKLAHHMAQKQAKQAEAEEAEEADDVVADKKDDKSKKKDDVPDDDGEDDTAESKESNREKVLSKKLLEAEGRLAALEAKNKKAEVTEYVDGKLKESGQPNTITKKFREAAGEIKSKKDFDSKWKVFMEGVSNSRSEIDWGAFQEKTVSKEDGSPAFSGKKLDFSGCAE